MNFAKVDAHNNKYKQRRVRQSKHDNDHWFTAEKTPTENVNWELTDKAALYCVRVYRYWQVHTVVYTGTGRYTL